MGTVSNRGTKDRPLWYIRYIDSDGKRKQRPSHQPTKKDALRYLAEVEARVARREMGIPEVSPEERQRRTITVRALAEKFLAEYDRPKIRNPRRYRALVRAYCNRRLFPFPLASMTAAAVKRRDIDAYRDALRRAEFSPKTVNTSLAFLSRIFSWGIESELIDRGNPVARIERLPTQPSTEHYTREQVAALLSEDEPHPMIATALYTGMRKGELLGLTWGCVRFDLGAIEVRKSFNGPPKNGSARIVPLHPELAPILRLWRARCPRTAQDMVFPVMGKTGWRAGQCFDLAGLRLALAAAGCPWNLCRPWHAMRHTFATLFAESGASPEALSRILGHTGQGNAVTAGYVHVQLPYLAQEMRKLSLRPAPPAGIIALPSHRQTA